MEMNSGILSGVLGVAGLAMVLFGPVYQVTGYNTSNGTVQASQGLLTDSYGFLLLPPPTIYLMPIIIALVPPLLVLAGTLLHSRQHGSLVGLVLLVGATVALLLGVIFNPIELLRLFLLPSLLLALVTCALIFRNGRQPSRVAAGQGNG
jgi:hypothetical protein